jgi:hypothetical protein
MWQFINSHIGFFDAGTSDPGSISLRFPANGRGTLVCCMIQHWKGTGGTTSPPQRTLLPMHRTLSGGLLFTLPDAELLVFVTIQIACIAW